MSQTILDVRVDDFSLDQVMAKIDAMLKDGSKHYIVTTNPEFLMAARKDDQFRTILNRSDLSVVDGFGIVLMSSLAGKKINNRISGVDLLKRIAKYCADYNYSLALIGAGEGVARIAAEKLQHQYPNLNISFAISGGKIGQSGILEDEKRIIKLFNDNKPDIIGVALGHGKQEKWIDYYLPLIPAKLAIGIGGSLDYISGQVKRAPKFVQALGLEWLWRLVRQPWRIKRIYTAVIKFPLIVIFRK